MSFEHFPQPPIVADVKQFNLERFFKNIFRSCSLLGYACVLQMLPSYRQVENISLECFSIWKWQFVSNGTFFWESATFMCFKSCTEGKCSQFSTSEQLSENENRGEILLIFWAFQLNRFISNSFVWLTFQHQEEFTENTDKFSYRKKNLFSSSIPYLRITVAISPTIFFRSVIYRAILMLFECHVILTSNSSWSGKNWKKPPDLYYLNTIPRLTVRFLFREELWCWVRASIYLILELFIHWWQLRDGLIQA